MGFRQLAYHWSYIILVCDWLLIWIDKLDVLLYSFNIFEVILETALTSLSYFHYGNGQILLNTIEKYNIKCVCAYSVLVNRFGWKSNSTKVLCGVLARATALNSCVRGFDLNHLNTGRSSRFSDSAYYLNETHRLDFQNWKVNDKSVFHYPYGRKTVIYENIIHLDCNILV